MKKIRKGDDVIVITGFYKNKRGIVSSVLTDGRLIVSGVNEVFKHVKPNPQREIVGGINKIEAPIQASNVMLFNPKTNKGDKVSIGTTEDGKKARFFKSTNEKV